MRFARDARRASIRAFNGPHYNDKTRTASHHATEERFERWQRQRLWHRSRWWPSRTQRSYTSKRGYASPIARLDYASSRCALILSCSQQLASLMSAEAVEAGMEVIDDDPAAEIELSGPDSYSRLFNAPNGPPLGHRRGGDWRGVWPQHLDGAGWVS